MRSYFESGRPAAVICDGPWTLVEADVVRDRHITPWPSRKTDITNAGESWVDEEVVECDCGPSLLISSRKPDDLGSLCSARPHLCSRRDPRRLRASSRLPSQRCRCGSELHKWHRASVRGGGLS
ncbi:MAG: DJ-1/PfpI family protein [Acidimicrobiales bacterium]